MKPSDFYIGISELFAILLPGYLVIIASLYYVGDVTFDKDVGLMLGLLLFSGAYTLGHLLFAIGSFWDEINNLMPYKGNDSLLSKVSEIRSGLEDDCDDINNYQWTKSLLLMRNSMGHMEVLRKEADSKLFRSIVFPLIILMLYVWIYVSWKYGLALIILIVLAYWRYREQRNKGCAIAYTHLITLFHNK